MGKERQQYFEGINGRLIPVKNSRRSTKKGIVAAEVQADGLGYRKGETLTFPYWHLVEKTGRVFNGRILVRTVSPKSV